MTGQISPRGFWAHLRSGDWVSWSRVVTYARIFAIANMAGLGFAILRAHGWLVARELHLTTEFMSFFTAGRMVNAGHAVAVYMPPVLPGYVHSNAIPAGFQAMQQIISGDPGIHILGFFYPPVFWLVCAPLARLGFYQADAIWVGAGLISFTMLVRQLAGSWRYLWLLLGYVPVLKNAAVGENAFFSASLVGFGLLNLQARPVLAGMLFGAVCYKPHFLLPIGILLLAGRHWRSLISMGATASMLCALAGMLFGWQNWVDYFRIVVPHAEYMFAHQGFSYGLQVTPFSSVRILGGGIGFANAVQLATALFAALAIIIACRRASPDIQAAIVTASFPLIASVMLDYDLCITGLAILFLYRAARVSGFRPYEKTMMAAMFVMPYMILYLRTQLHIPLDPLIPALFIITLLARCRTVVAA